MTSKPWKSSNGMTVTVGDMRRVGKVFVSKDLYELLRILGVIK